MFQRKGHPGPWTALAALWLLSWAVAPWLGAALIFTAPARAADAGAQIQQDAPSGIPGGQKLIALTFDDGPRRSTTSALLDGLAQRGVKATFDHVQLTGLSKADFDAQVSTTRQILTNLLGHNGFLLRPPYGLTDDAVRKNAGCPIILWSIDPEDWGDQNAPREVEHVVSHARDGSIILMHDIFPASVEAALQIVDQLHAQGYLFVTVEELFAARHVTLEPGGLYAEAYP